MYPNPGALDRQKRLMVGVHCLGQNKYLFPMKLGQRLKLRSLYLILVFTTGLFHARVQFIQEAFQFSSVAQSCPPLCNPMNRSTPGLPVHHQLPESTQTRVHRVGDAIQPSHPLSSPSQSFPASGSFQMSQLLA